MTVTVTNNAAIGLGNNVTMDGQYTKGEPVYQNVSRVSPLSEQEVMREARILLGNDAYQFVADIITDGTWEETVETTGVKGQMYRYTVRAAGLGVDILSGDNGHLYIGLTGYSPEGAYVYYTDDSNYRDKMPSDFDALRGGDSSKVELYFRGK